MSPRGEVPRSRLQRVPVYKQAGRSAAIELKGRICCICQRNDLEMANRKGELVAVDGKPVHLICADQKDLAKRAEPQRQMKPEKKPLKFKVRDPDLPVVAEVESIFVLPLAVLAVAEPKTMRRWEKDFRLANLAVSKSGAAVAMEAMAAQ